MNPADPSIAAVLHAYREAKPEDASANLVTNLLADYLDSYGHTMLEMAELAFWEERFNDEEEGSFCNLFGPTYILEGLEEFLGWFVIRKVIMPSEDVARIGRAAGALVDWLVDRGYVHREAADGAGELSAAAVRNLPDADRLGELLYRHGEALAAKDVQEYVDWENELAQISRVEPGELWFRSELGEIGPVKGAGCGDRARTRRMAGVGARVRPDEDRLVRDPDRERVPVSRR
jgi:hypothetical protein